VVTRWTEPYRYTCAGCGVVADGCLGAGFFGEPTDSLPQGWRRRRNAAGALFACSAACAAKVDAAEASDG